MQRCLKVETWKKEDDQVEDKLILCICMWKCGDYFVTILTITVPESTHFRVNLIIKNNFTLGNNKDNGQHMPDTYASITLLWKNSYVMFKVLL